MSRWNNLRIDFRSIRKMIRIVLVFLLFFLKPSLNSRSLSSSIIESYKSDRCTWSWVLNMWTSSRTFAHNELFIQYNISFHFWYESLLQTKIYLIDCFKKIQNLFHSCMRADIEMVESLTFDQIWKWIHKDSALNVPELQPEINQLSSNNYPFQECKYPQYWISFALPILADWTKNTSMSYESIIPTRAENFQGYYWHGL